MGTVSWVSSAVPIDKLTAGSTGLDCELIVLAQTPRTYQPVPEVWSLHAAGFPVYAIRLPPKATRQSMHLYPCLQHLIS